MKTQIFFVRHGEVYNPKQIIYGRLPRFHLTQKGKTQAEKTAEHLSKLKISAVYASPLLRARQTATIINTHVKTQKIYCSKNILEIRTHLDGKSNSFFDTPEANFYANEIKQPLDESIDDVLNRMLTFVKSVSKKHQGENIVAVSHGDPLMILKSHIQNGNVTIQSIRPGSNLYINHAEVYCVIVNEKSIESVTATFNPNRQ